MAQLEGLSSVLDGRSFAFNQEEELMTCHQIIQNLHPYWSYFHIFSVTQIQGKFPCLRHLRGWQNLRIRRFEVEDIRWPSTCDTMPTVSSLRPRMLYIHTQYIYIYIFIILFIYCYFKEVETMKQPKVQALQSAARSAACCLSSLPKGCSSCTDLHSDIEHSLSKTEQKNT